MSLNDRLEPARDDALADCSRCFQNLIDRHFDSVECHVGRPIRQDGHVSIGVNGS